MSEIEYFCSARSAYAYLGSARFMEIARAAGRCIVHKPVDLDKVLEGVGYAPFVKRKPNQRAYFFADAIAAAGVEPLTPAQLKLGYGAAIAD